MSSKLKRRFFDNFFEVASIVAEGCFLEGNVRCNNAFILSGSVLGDGIVEGSVQVIQTGRWQGNIRCGDISIAGEVEGQVQSSGKIEIMDSAVIKGSISGGQIAVARGAQILGEMVVRDGSDVKMFEERRKNG